MQNKNILTHSIRNSHLKKTIQNYQKTRFVYIHNMDILRPSLKIPSGPRLL